MLSDASVHYASKAQATKPLLHTLEEFHILLNSCLWTLVLFTSWKIWQTTNLCCVKCLWKCLWNVISNINSVICIHSYVVPKLYVVVLFLKNTKEVLESYLFAFRLKAVVLSDRSTAGRGLLGSCRAGSGSPGEPGAHMWGRSGQCPGASPAREDDSC